MMEIIRALAAGLVVLVYLVGFYLILLWQGKKRGE